MRTKAISFEKSNNFKITLFCAQIGVVHNCLLLGGGGQLHEALGAVRLRSLQREAERARPDELKSQGFSVKKATKTIMQISKSQ